jgi:UDP-glucose 4-epimerase
LKAFITGGAGFIGSHLVDKLLGQENDVVVYDNLSSGKKEFVESHFGNSHFQFIEADLADKEKLEASMIGADVVFHLAANPDARAGIINTRLDLDLNTNMTYNVLECMRKNGIKKIVFTSSGCVYGETPIIPIDENYGPLKPISLYGASKLACEGLISAFSSLFNIQAWIFRPGNVVGPRATHGVMYDLIKKLSANPEYLEVLGDGNQTKPYIHVDDCTNGLLFGFNKGAEQVNLFNLAVASETSVKEIARYILEMTKNSETPLRFSGGKAGWPGDVSMVKLANRRLALLGWKPKFTSAEAVRMTIQSLIKEQYIKRK